MKKINHALKSCSVAEILSRLKSIGKQINKLMVLTDWDPALLPVTGQVVSDIRQIRDILRQAA